MFRARKFFRALSLLISPPRQEELPLDNRGKFRRRNEEPIRTDLPGLLGDVGGIKHLLLLDRTTEDRAVA